MNGTADDSSAAAVRDVAVVGGGLAGVVAALRAAEVGASVVLLEAGDEVGGTALHSGGGVHIWGVQTWEEYLGYCPQAPERLARALVEGYGSFVEWLQATGAPGSYGVAETFEYRMAKYQIGNWFVPSLKRRWFDYLADRLRSRGAAIHTNARVTAVRRSDGVFVLTAGGHELQARAVVLAAGGFQASPELLAEHIGADPSTFVRRSVRHVVGDGLSLALSVGAARTERMDTLYGHLMPAPPCRISWTNHVDPALLSGFYAKQSAVLNVHGERFVDEGKGELNGETINAAVRQPPGGLWIVFDEAIRRDRVKRAAGEVLDRRSFGTSARLIRFARLRRVHGQRVGVFLDTLAFARARGAVVVEARTLDELAVRLGARGVDAGRALATLREFDDAAAAGRAAGLAVPKTEDAHPLRTPPFYAVKVAVGVSMTYGGVAIDEWARALDAAGDPVPGLFAAPGTAGGVHQLHYGGALAACGVFGMIAGEQAAAATNAAREATAALAR